MDEKKEEYDSDIKNKTRKIENKKIEIFSE